MSETFTITVEPLGREVECRSDQPILDACLRAGVWLPHACTHGTCGTCKVEVLDGDVEHNDASDFALMEFERNEGKTLTCVATPESDVTIEADIEFEEGVVHHPVEDFIGTVVVLDDIARETRRLVIDLDHEMTFNPGQYVTIDVPGKGVTRTYSMANPPGEPGRIELQIRRTPGWARHRRVDLQEPRGRRHGAALRDLTAGSSTGRRAPEPAILIGGGTGLAPLKSIVRHVLETGPAAAPVPLPGRPDAGRPLRRGVLPRAGGGARRPVHLPALPAAT